MYKCPICGADMKVLFTGFYCPNDCDKKDAQNNDVEVLRTFVNECAAMSLDNSTQSISQLQVKIFTRIDNILQQKWRRRDLLLKWAPEVRIVIFVTEREYALGADRYIRMEIDKELIQNPKTPYSNLNRKRPSDADFNQIVQEHRIVYPSPLSWNEIIDCTKNEMLCTFNLDENFTADGYCLVFKMV